MRLSLGKRRPRIFLSYRRDDSEASTDFLLERLVAYFGKQQVFVDVDDVSVGEDFVRAIEQAVGSCDVLLAVIGKHWLTLTSARGRRLDADEDFVRLEIATALGRDILVIPVLVQGASMPRPEDLPEDLKPLSRRQAFTISRAHRREDAARLIHKIERATAQRAAPRKAMAPRPRPDAPAPPARPASRYLPAALTFLVVLSLTAGAWRLYRMRAGEGAPTLDATPAPATSETPAPSETPATPSEATPAPTPESTSGTPDPAAATPPPAAGPAGEKPLEQLTLPPATPASPTPPAASPTPTPMPALRPIFKILPPVTPTPTPDFPDEFDSPARMLPRPSPTGTEVERGPTRPTPTPERPPTFEEWGRERRLRGRPAPTPAPRLPARRP